MKANFDIVVAGAGPAGLAAAHAAASGGLSVAVIDDNPRAGGQIWRQGPHAKKPAALSRMLGDLIRNPNVTSYQATRISLLADAREMIVDCAEHGGMSISFARLVIATGARERLLPFDGWTLPGVTGAGGLQALIKGGMPVRGERVVLAGSGPLLIAALATARAAGARVLAVVEQAPWRAVLPFGLSLAATPSKLGQALRLTRGFTDTRYWTGSVLTRALGNERVEGAIIRRGGRDITLACDRIAGGYGLVPNVALAQMAGCALASGAVAVDEGQRTSVQNVWAAGECTGIGGTELARVEGRIAGLAASGQAVSASDVRERERWRRFARRAAHAFELGASARAWPSAETIVCRCEDVAFGDVAAHASWREAKLQTRCGMGPCQGRVCGAALETYFGWDAALPRPPLVPMRIGALLQAREHDDARL
ncbi:FAD/NAD(P)-binding oxidoreductase [Trinickia dabaoshanensis]|uniref:FAD/NAD(P)-binding oxidoreductase n=1 Tax=Trinickia dabaoshanensis TaxID=564714 RepID=A0A2N7VY83_9BURK|nr:FAD/NAD(P)-binding oxidoreductase [Trinickia dabaoshanensis]PMS22106.1 FAD/NAD(P)-binding oxidoreductase [Trinickia dabaoshanensis]